MSSPYVVLGDRTLDQWKVTELKEELKKRKLAIKGLKEDLVKRLDEAVRIERQHAEENADNGLDRDTPSELPSEPEGMEQAVSIRSENLLVKEINVVENLASNPENEVDDRRAMQDESRAVEAGPGQETSDSVLEEEQVGQLATVETTVLVSETVESSAVSGGALAHGFETSVAGDSMAGLGNEELKALKEDINPDYSNLSDHVNQVTESNVSVLPTSGPTQGTETRDEASNSTAQLDGFKPDHPPQPLKYQVSEAGPNLGSQVISDSVSSESVNIIEKNELKADLNTDNVKLELDVKHEMVHPPISSSVPDVGESHPMDVEESIDKKEIEEPIEKRDVEEPIEKRNVEKIEEKGFEEPLDKKVYSGINAEKNDSVKEIDIGELGPTEKLNLDDLMEEDTLEGKHIDNLEKSEMLLSKDDDIGVKGVSNAENETVPAASSVKRKFQEKEASGINENLKRPRRWNVESNKVSEPLSGETVSVAMTKDTSQPTLKRLSRSDSGASQESPKERVVPPSLKPSSNSLKIDRFLRPFTLKAVQELLGKTGTVTSFWMDNIKTHCYVSYSTVEEAVETRNAVYNLQWPPNGGRLLVAEFVDPQEVKTRVEGAPAALPTTPSSSAVPTLSAAQGQLAAPIQQSPRQQVPRQQLPPPSLPPPPLANPPPVRERAHPAKEPQPLPKEQPVPARDRLNLPPPPPLPEKFDPPIVTLDDLFRKTKATPRIYYLPLSEEQVAVKLKAQGKNVIQ